MTMRILSEWQAAGLTLREGYGCVLPNVWLGVSCENQETADRRIPLLLQTPAAVRFVSLEPLLGPIDLRLGCKIKEEVPCKTHHKKGGDMNEWPMDLRVREFPK